MSQISFPLWFITTQREESLGFIQKSNKSGLIGLEESINEIDAWDYGFELIWRV